MEDYCGEEIKAIVNKRFRRREDMPHVIMIDGPRGTGKTTFSRIVTKYFLCQNLTENGPCNECEICQQIDEVLISGQSAEVECPGVTELDATIMNGKEAIQNVLDDAMQTPIYTDLKVLIVDECHMITQQAQNSMLKIIEDIPPHLVVIFATTNPEKVLDTIKSRCQLTLHTKKQSVDTMAKRLEQISELEGLEFSEEALKIISKRGNRVPRECINLLETIAKTYDDKVTLDNVKDYLGNESGDICLEYFRAANSSLANVLMFIRGLREKNIEISKFCSKLASFVQDSMYIKHGIALDDYPQEYVRAIKDMFNTYTSNDFDMLVQCIDYSLHNTFSDNNDVNEMTLTLTAMRISKIGLLAKGLNNEQSLGNEENRISLSEHSKLLQVDTVKALERMQTSLDLEDINEEFENVSTVADDVKLNMNFTLPELEVTEQKEEKNNINENIGEGIDSFFDN